MSKKNFILIFIFVILISCKNTEKISNETTLIDNIFTNSNAEGTLVIYNLNDDKYIIHNKERAEQRFYPASTFKIYNSLIGLNEKAVKDVDEVFYKYNGEKVFLESWAKDSNLRYAIKNSQVPAYKELARRNTYQGAKLK